MKSSSGNMSDERPGPETKVFKGLISKRLCPILVALFVCLSETKGKLQVEPKYSTAAHVELSCHFEFPENKRVPYFIQWYKQGIPDPFYVWCSNRRRLWCNTPRDRFSVNDTAKNDKVQQVSLSLDKVYCYDRGWYKCRVIFDYRVIFDHLIPYDSLQKIIWVHLDVNDSRCLPDEEPKRFSANIGENVVLFCGFEFPENKHEPFVIQWHKQGIKIPIYFCWYDGYPPHSGAGYEGRLSLAHQASLNITKVRETDQGWYECRVYFLNRPPPTPPMNGTWVHLDVNGLNEKKHDVNCKES